MKKSIFLILLAAELTMMGCAPVSAPDDNVDMTDTGEAVQTAETTVDYSTNYQPIVNDFYKLVSGQIDISAGDSEMPTGSMGLWEGITYGSIDTMKEDTGFCISDFSGDGIPELVIGSVSNGMIYALFGIADGGTRLLLEGAYRNMYFFLDDGMILNQGSAGAIYSILGILDWSDDGAALNIAEYWYTHEKDGNFDDICCYYNTTGEMDPTISEELVMTVDEFIVMQESVLSRVTVPELTSFAQYGGVS